MNKTLDRETENRIAVDASKLAGMLGCGRVTAAKIGSDAGARIEIGRRVLYKISIVEKYLEKLAK